MPEEMNTATAQTSEQVSQTDKDAGVGQGEGVNDTAFSDTPPAADTAAGEEKGGAAEEGKQPQSREQNAENARRRREAERLRELEEARNKAIIEALDGKNPYTDGEMKDAEDVAEFLAMREIEKKGGDPVGDYSRHVKERARSERESAAREAERRAWFEKDRADFAVKYPDVDLGALVENRSFRMFAEGKVGERPLGDIYESYLAMTGEIETAAKRTAAQTVANAAASPGRLSGGGAVESDFFTAEQVRNMTPAQIDANYDKIMASRKRW